MNVITNRNASFADEVRLSFLHVILSRPLVSMLPKQGDGCSPMRWDHFCLSARQRQRNLGGMIAIIYNNNVTRFLSWRFLVFVQVQFTSFLILKVMSNTRESMELDLRKGFEPMLTRRSPEKSGVSSPLTKNRMKSICLQIVSRSCFYDEYLQLYLLVYD